MCMLYFIAGMVDRFQNETSLPDLIEYIIYFYAYLRSLKGGQKLSLSKKL